MSIPLATLSVERLKKSLAACDLPIYGTKEQMAARLFSCEKKKPGPKPKGDGVVIPKKRKATSSAPKAPIDTAELDFYATERKRLAASGMTGYQEQTTELRRRWDLLKNAKSSIASVPTLATAPANAVKLPAQLDAAQLRSSNLELHSIETNPSGACFVYVPKGTSSPSSSAGKAKANPAPKAAAAKPKAAPESDDDDDCDGDEDSDAEMAWPCEVSTKRIMKKLKKETMIAMAVDFGIPHSGGKKVLAEDLSTQLHYETADDEENEDDDDGE